jgi:hypothetical protein
MANSPQSTPSNICVGTLANPGAITCNTTYTAAQYQTALNNAACGQTIILSSAAAYGDSFTLPHGVYCPANNWVIVTRDTTDTTFPAEGQRVDPCFIGITQAKMPYCPYPSWDTSPSCARHMPQIITNSSTFNAAFGFGSTAPPTGNSVSHWRFVGLDITRGGANNASLNYDINNALVTLSWQPGTDCATDANGNPTNPTTCMNDQPTNIVFDRCILHGDPIHQTTRAFNFGGTRFVAVIDSYIYDIGLTYVSSRRRH